MQRRMGTAQAMALPLLSVGLLLVLQVGDAEAGVLYYHAASPHEGPAAHPSPVTGPSWHRLVVHVLATDGGDGVYAGFVRAGSLNGDATLWHFEPAGRPATMIPPPTLPVVKAPLTRGIPPGAASALGAVPAYGATAVAWAGGALFAGTDVGFLRIVDNRAAWFTEFIGVHLGSFVWPGPQQVRRPVAALTADGEGYIWATDGLRRGPSTELILFCARPERWEDHDSGGPLPAPYPRLLRCRAPLQAMTGDPVRAGVWVYGMREDGNPDLMRLDPSMAGPLPTNEAPSSVPLDVSVPAVAEPKMAAGPDGRVWVAGDTLDGPKLYVFDGQAFTNVTPAAGMFHARRFTQLMAGPRAELYASTDGVGVLVREGTEWRPHPINDFLPTLEGTELKPVSCMALDSEGNLWIGTDNNVICWRPDKPQP